MLRSATLSLAVIVGILFSMSAGSSGEAPKPDPVMANYAQSVSTQIQRNLRYPEEELAGKREGIAYVVMTVDSNGLLTEAILERSSGIEAFDSEALTTIRRSAPFAKLPEHLARDTMQLRVPVVFKLRPTAGREPMPGGDVMSYGLSVRGAIAKNWRPIAGSQLLQGESIVSLTIDREGRIVDAVLEKSSGVESLDEETLAAVRRTAPFGKIPDAHPGKTMQMKLHFCTIDGADKCTTRP